MQSWQSHPIRYFSRCCEQCFQHHRDLIRRQHQQHTFCPRPSSLASVPPNPTTRPRPSAGSNLPRHRSTLFCSSHCHHCHLRRPALRLQSKPAPSPRQIPSIFPPQPKNRPKPLEALDQDLQHDGQDVLHWLPQQECSRKIKSGKGPPSLDLQPPMHRRKLGSEGSLRPPLPFIKSSDGESAAQESEGPMTPHLSCFELMLPSQPL